METPLPFPVPATESERLADLRSLQVMNTPPEEPFDGIVEVAAALFDAPFAILTLIDAEHQWFKASVGVPFCATPRSLSFCAHTIMGTETMVVEDLTQDPRFANNPFVVGEPRLRFYAGAPLVTLNRQSIGTICILDVEPRSLSRERMRLLERVARQVVDALEMRKLVCTMAEGMERAAGRRADARFGDSEPSLV